METVGKQTRSAYSNARSAISAAQRKKPEKLTRLERWMLELNARVGYYKALVAIANKHAHLIWAMLAKGEAYDPKYGQGPLN
jgi:transposase